MGSAYFSESVGKYDFTSNVKKIQVVREPLVLDDIKAEMYLTKLEGGFVIYCL